MAVGAEQALQWLFENESDPAADAPLQGYPGQAPEMIQSFAASTPGIAGILKREQEIAARNDRLALLQSISAHPFIGKEVDPIG